MVLAVVSMALAAAVGATASEQSVCVPIKRGGLVSVQCVQQADIAQAVAEATRNDEYPISARAIHALFAGARQSAGISPSQALVADHAYRLFGRTLRKPTKRSNVYGAAELTEPLPRLPDALMADPIPAHNAAVYDAKMRQMAMQIDDDAGDNTEGEMLYGPPEGPCGLFACYGRETMGDCKKCCDDQWGTAVKAIGAGALACHGFAGLNLAGQAICAVSELVLGAAAILLYDHCQGPHCETKYANERSIFFTGYTMQFLTQAGWDERADVVVRDYGDNGLRVLRDTSNNFVCYIKPAHPLHDELPANALLRIAYDGSPCSVKDYRVLDMDLNTDGNQVPTIGLVRYDGRAWYVERRSGKPLELRRLVGPFLSLPSINDAAGRSYGWQDGAKVMLWGPTSADLMLVMGSKVLRQPRGRQ